MEQEKIFARLLPIITRYYREQGSGPFVDYLDPDDLDERLQLDNGGGRQDWEELFTWVEQYLRHAVKTGHPGYVNRMWADANLPSVIGEMITAITNTSACTYETAPVSTLMEKYLLRTMLELAGFENGSAQMTTGSSNANMIAMMAARNTRDAAIKRSGLSGRPQLYGFVNADAHYSMDRAANILGIGIENLIKVPVDDHGRMTGQPGWMRVARIQRRVFQQAQAPAMRRLLCGLWPAMVAQPVKPVVGMPAQVLPGQRQRIQPQDV